MICVFLLQKSLLKKNWNCPASLIYYTTVLRLNLTQKIAGKIGYNGTNSVKNRIPLKYLSNFKRTFEMPLINCEINFILTWSAVCSITDAPIADQEPTLTIIDTNLYVPVVTLPTQDNTKILKQLKSNFKRTIGWKKYHPKVTAVLHNWYLDFLINPSFQKVFNILFYHLKIMVVRDIKLTRCISSTSRNKGVWVDGWNLFDQPVKNDFITYDNIRKIATGQGDDFIIGCLLDYLYFKNYYKMIATDLSKQHALDANPNVIQ